MKEIKPRQQNETETNVEEIPKDKPKNLVEQMKELKQFKEQVISGEIKTKKLKIPRKCKVKKRKLKKGYIGILRVDENNNVTPEKQRVYGSSYRDKEGFYHATDGREILWWMGKFPILIQPSWKNNPLNINSKEEKNETYGQPYIKAKMLADTIKVKSKGGNVIIWVLIVGAVLFGINYAMGGNLFG